MSTIQFTYTIRNRYIHPSKCQFEFRRIHYTRCANPVNPVRFVCVEACPYALDGVRHQCVICFYLVVCLLLLINVLRLPAKLHARELYGILDPLRALTYIIIRTRPPSHTVKWVSVCVRARVGVVYLAVPFTFRQKCHSCVMSACVVGAGEWVVWRRPQLAPAHINFTASERKTERRKSAPLTPKPPPNQTPVRCCADIACSSRKPTPEKPTSMKSKPFHTNMHTHNIAYQMSKMCATINQKPSHAQATFPTGCLEVIAQAHVNV